MAVWLRARSELRTGMRGWVAIAALAALVGGIAMAAAASARRTESAVPRSIERSNFSDVTIQQFEFPAVDYRKIRRLPEVAYSYRADNFFFTGETDEGRALDVGLSGLIASADPTVGVSRGAPAIVRGRRANPRDPNEAVADEEAARLLGLDVGDTFTARFAAPDQLGAFFAATGDPTKFPTEGPEATFRVVGISAVFPTTTSNYPEIQLTAAFHRQAADRTARIQSVGAYLTHGDADIPQFERGVEQLPNSASIEFAEGPGFIDEVQRGVHIQAGALWVLAGLAAIVGVLLVGQAVARLTFEEATDFPTLRAIGMTRGQLWALAVVRAAGIGLVAALGAVALTIALSPLSPVGTLARKAEPDPGLSADWLVIAGGATILLLVVVTSAAITGWRAARQAETRAETTGRALKPSAIAERIARAGAPTTAVSGIRMALEPGHGASAVPTRTSIGGAAIAVVAIAAALTFSASLNHLVDTPALYGQTWSVQFGDGFNPDVADIAYPVLRDNRFVDAFAGGTIDEASVAGEHVGVLALEQQQGTIGPALVEGSAPAAEDEILLDPGTFEDIGAEIGDEVAVAGGRASVHMEIVGTGVLSDISGAQPLLGGGAMLTLDGFRRLAPDAERNYFFARFKPGVDEEDAVASLARFDAIIGEKPVDVANYDRVNSVPVVIGALLLVIGAATLFHTLVTSIRRRRRDLAILKVLGFERTQVSRMVAWQAMTIVLIALLIGIPVGIAVGRWGWTIFTNELGVVPDAVVPALPLLLLVPAALLIANLIAVIPGAIAGRTPPAAVLRAE